MPLGADDVSGGGAVNYKRTKPNAEPWKRKLVVNLDSHTVDAAHAIDDMIARLPPLPKMSERTNGVEGAPGVLSLSLLATAFPALNQALQGVAHIERQIADLCAVSGADTSDIEQRTGMARPNVTAEYVRSVLFSDELEIYTNDVAEYSRRLNYLRRRYMQAGEWPVMP
jgi:hypothetical protein